MAGIIDTIKLAGTLVLAIPAALAGFEFLVVRGEPLVGIVLLGLAVALVLVQKYVPFPSDIPEMVAKRFVGSVTKEPETDEE